MRGFNPHRLRRAGATATHNAGMSIIRRRCFNPHRPAKAGATVLHAPRVAHSSSFNPHRPAKAGATKPLSRWTSPSRFQSSPACEGRCYTSASEPGTWTACFNPHRPAKAGATNGAGAPAGHLAGVSILTGLRRPVLPLSFGRVCTPGRFQSSPACEGRCYSQWQLLVMGQTVSILTGLRRPVLPATSSALGGVKIGAFQSSPACEGRCYKSRLSFCPIPPQSPSRTRGPKARTSFNPHRPAKAGATKNYRGWRTAVKSFNPHRPAKAGATAPDTSEAVRSRFQSSPACEGRCYCRFQKRKRTPLARQSRSCARARVFASDSRARTSWELGKSLWFAPCFFTPRPVGRA